MEMSIRKNKTPVKVLAIAPATWAIHFLFVYLLAAIICAKAPEKYALVRSLTGIATIGAIIILLREIAVSWGKHNLGESRPPHDAPTHLDRERFLGMTRLLISSLSLLAVGYTTYAVYFFGSCR